MDFNIEKVKLIAGLGNIGKTYAKTRHNVGFMFLDYIAKTLEFNAEPKLKSDILKLEIKNTKMILAKPLTMMNLSGDALSLLKKYYKLENSQILLVHDDLDLAIGNFKIHFARGPSLHNGVNSVENKLGGKDFFRLRIGVDNRSLEMRGDTKGIDYVLGKFTSYEEKILKDVFDQILERF